MTRKDAQDKARKYEKLKNIKYLYETEVAEVIAWRIFGKMDESKKADIRTKWNKYYKDVQETHAYKRYQAQKEAYFKNDFGTVKALSEEAKNDHGPWLKKPSSFDPDLLEVKEFVQRYKNVCYKLSELQDEIDEVENTSDLFSKAKNIFNI